MIIFLLVFAIIRTRAAPLSAGLATDPTIAHTYLFGVEPRAASSEASMRTLYDVAKSCFITIAACVYRSIHQNIPDPSLGFWGRLRIRAKITFYALIAPELMITWAIRQRFGARKAMRHINKRIPGLKWTLVHGQFIQMGGFVRHDNKKILLSDDIIELFEKDQLELGELALVTKEDIQDKSKGDILSKGLVAFQTTWFVFECLARLQQGLLLLELEVVTLAFATLNIIIYFLWWYKPLDVLRPICVHVKPDPSEKVDSHTSAGGNAMESGAEAVPLVSQSAVVVEESTEGLAMPKAGMGMRARAAVERLVDIIAKDIQKRPWYMTIWKRLIKQPFLAVVEPLGQLMDDESSDNDMPTSVPMFSAIPAMEFDDGTGPITALLISFIGVIFGAIHFLSWNATFPTHTQLLLWRASSVILVAEPGLVLLGGVIFFTFYLLSLFMNLVNGWEIRWVRYLGQRLADIFAALEEAWDKLQEMEWVDNLLTCLAIVSFVGAAITPILYVLARFCLLVLAFLTLRDLPPHALDTISWTSYIPHL